jgi:predicted RNase H-like HicB family nuclease
MSEPRSAYPACGECGWEPYGTPGAPCEREGCAAPGASWWHAKGGLHWLVCDQHRQTHAAGPCRCDHDHGRSAPPFCPNCAGCRSADSSVHFVADGGYWIAEDPSRPGCHHIGPSSDAALAGLADAREHYDEVRANERGESRG